MNIGVVVLNYLNWRDTVECVHSLLEQSYSNLSIVIVDNSSKNESTDVFVSEFKQFSNVYIIESKENEGFARGNNIGIDFCMNELKINNIFVTNNDTVFNDKDYFSKLTNRSIENNVGVIGTEIIGADGLNQNPFKARIDFQFLVKRYFVLTWGILRNRMQESSFFLSKLILRVYKNYKDKQSKAEIMENSTNSDPGSGDPKDISLLHGSALFFTENYLEKIKGFYPGTFLYNEERILHIMLKKMNLEAVYIPDLHLYHKEDQSSALSFGNNSDRMKAFSQKSTFEVIKVKLFSKRKIKKNVNKYNYRYDIIKPNKH